MITAAAVSIFVAACGGGGSSATTSGSSTMDGKTTAGPVITLRTLVDGQSAGRGADYFIEQADGNDFQ